ncbi:MAG: YihY/virulence factor BrkB family protein [Gemmatimonadota bacterium]|nr:YihY/virulence factor BrkB family protein [Gemmatimonadota bacterium]
MKLQAGVSRARDLAGFCKSLVREFFEDDMPTYAAAIAFHALFALFPFVLFLLTLLGFFDLPVVFSWLVEGSASLLPPSTSETVQRVIAEIRERRETGLLSFGILSAIWLASAGVRATMTALNVAFDLAEERSFWKRYLLSIAYTLALAVTIVLATLLAVVGPRAISWLAMQLGIDPLVVTLWSWLRIPIAGLLALAAAAVVYHVAPNREQRFRVVSPGSVLAVAFWAIGAVGINYYVSSFSRFSLTYGSIGAVIVLLLFFYMSALVLLLGAELNAELRQRRLHHGCDRGMRPDCESFERNGDIF